jgi:hypothetical protein
MQFVKKYGPNFKITGHIRNHAMDEVACVFLNTSECV